MRPAGLIGAVAILAAAAGCRSIEGTRGIPPFWEVYDTPSTFGAGDGTETLVRPLWAHESTVGGSRRLRIAIPFLDFAVGPAGTQYWVLPAFLYRSFPQPLGGRDRDWLVLLLLAGGDDPEEGSYFAFLPFFGTLKGWLARDEIRFVLFPAWASTRDRARRSVHVLWPFYNRVWGGDWSGWRLWPFWSHYRSWMPDGSPHYDRTYVLWPFYFRNREDLRLNPTEVLFVFPFYGERVNRRTRTVTYLWPLFQSHHDRKYDRTTYAGYLWPYRFGPGHTDIWPFFGTKRVSRGTEIQGVVRRTYRHYALWPFERYEWGSDGLDETTRLWILPFFWHFHGIDRSDLATRSEVKLWPIFEYVDDRDRTAFDLISPLWFRREEYDRYWGRWFHVFRYRGGGPVGGWELLYGAVMYRRGDEGRERIFSILGGLLEFGRRDGAGTFRMLYIPLL